MSRVFLTVLDSFGIGELPDADTFGDKGSNTLGSIAKSSYFNADNLIKLGLGNIDGVSCIGKADPPKAEYCRLRELSSGKDTTTGHWEMSGIVLDSPFPTYPNGFPKEITDEFTRQTGRGVLCNKPYSGTVVINEYGDEHVKTGKLIVYTSADSVFQIAAHEDVVSLEELYECCKKARNILRGKHAVGRVIARPFTGSSGNYTRTSNRHDFSLEPTGRTMLDALYENRKDVIAVGKIKDIFAGRSISKHIPTHNNGEGMQAMLECQGEAFNGLCFTNLVDFDMLYGHRNDADGYAKAISDFDKFLPKFISGMRDDDILMITADHGCDPGDVSTDHTREYVPLLIYGKSVQPGNMGTVNGFCSIAVTVCNYLNTEPPCGGTNLLK